MATASAAREPILTLAEAFEEEHRVLDARIARALAAALGWDADLASAAFEELAPALLAHVDLAGRRLFEPFEHRTGLDERGPTAMLRREHHDIRRRIEVIRALLAEQNLKRASDEIRALHALLDDHGRREQSILCPACDRLFEPAERAGLVRDLLKR